MSVYKEDWTQNYYPGRTSYTPWRSHAEWTWHHNSKTTIKIWN